MIEKLLLVLAKNKMIIDAVVLLSLIMTQWPFYLMKYIAKKKKVNVEINADYFFAGIMLLFGLYALSYYIIEKAIEVSTTRGYLTITGKILTLIAFVVYIFIIYLFISMVCSTIYFWIKKEKQ